MIHSNVNTGGKSTLVAGNSIRLSSSIPRTRGRLQFADEGCWRREKSEDFKKICFFWLLILFQFQK